mmetsp:Transcript_27850/g.49445  ORF Transcript_27850/g.49445 Transcript_27850/m.49445 type:complete len:104 (-) Transcript_27850:478-789(-)
MQFVPFLVQQLVQQLQVICGGTPASSLRQSALKFPTVGMRQKMSLTLPVRSFAWNQKFSSLVRLDNCVEIVPDKRLLYTKKFSKLTRPPYSAGREPWNLLDSR